MNRIMEIYYEYERKHIDGNIYPIDHSRSDNKHEKILNANTETDLMIYNMLSEITESESEYYIEETTKPQTTVNN